MGKRALDEFGDLLMKRVRDQAILEAGREVRGMFQHLDGIQDDPLRRLVSTVVDITLHHVLWTFQQEEDLSITVKTKETTEDLREASVDGLEGELYDWIDKFSEYPRTD